MRHYICTLLLLRRGTHGGRVVSSHRGGIPARFRSGIGRSSGLIIRRSQVRILPGPSEPRHPVARICRRRAGLRGAAVRSFRHARRPLHSLAGRSRSILVPSGEARRGEALEARGAPQVARARLDVQGRQGGVAVVMSTGTSNSCQVFSTSASTYRRAMLPPASPTASRSPTAVRIPLPPRSAPAAATRRETSPAALSRSRTTPRRRCCATSRRRGLIGAWPSAGGPAPIPSRWR